MEDYRSRYLTIIDEPIAVTGQYDAAKAEWWHVDALQSLALDNDDIMADTMELYNQIQKSK